MCTINDRKWLIAKKDRVVYKVVTHDLVSKVPPEARPVLPGFKTRGEVLVYNIGTVVTSPSGPGIMAYKTKKTAEECRMYKDLIVRLTIKKGTIFCTGKHWSYDIITAQKVYVGKVYENGI